MRLSVADGSLYALMVGLGESYIVAFALAVGMNGSEAGLLTPIPQLGGAALGLLLPWVVASIGSIRAVTASLVSLQATAMMAFAVMALMGQFWGAGVVPPWLIFVVAGLYWSAGLAAGPAWMTWATDIFPRAMRPRFMASRARAHNICVIAGMVTGGLVLGRGGDGAGAEDMLAYAIVFGVSGALRFVSSWCMRAQSEPHPIPRGHRHVAWPEFLRSLHREQGGVVVGYMLAFSFATSVAVPFFAPYMLESDQLALTYPQFMTMIATAFVTRSIVLPTLGGIANRLGAKRVMLIGAIGTVALPRLWLISSSFEWLLAVHALTGVLWACYELATLLLLFDTVPQSRRVAVLSKFALLNGVAAASGAAVGALILGRVDQSERGYALLFVISSMFRLLALPLAMRRNRTADASGWR